MSRNTFIIFLEVGIKMNKGEDQPRQQTIKRLNVQSQLQLTTDNNKQVMCEVYIVFCIVHCSLIMIES